jgi:hypothetical protein
MATTGEIFTAEQIDYFHSIGQDPSEFVFITDVMPDPETAALYAQFILPYMSEEKSEIFEQLP